MALLRNLNSSSGGQRKLGSPFLGLAASALPLGFNPPCLLENDVLGGDAPGTLYAVRIKSWPSAGSLFVYPDSSFSFTGAADGIYTGDQEVRKYHPTSGLLSAELTTYSITVGAPPADTTPPTFTGTLAVTGVTPTGATVSWSTTSHTDNVGITGYDTSFDGSNWTPTGSTALSKAFTGLTPSTPYTVYVRARDAAGNLSAVLSAPFTTTAPPVQGSFVHIPQGNLAAVKADNRIADVY